MKIEGRKKCVEKNVEKKCIVVKCSKKYYKIRKNTSQ